jgi:mycothiol synthase
MDLIAEIFLTMLNITTQHILSRPFQGEDDFWRVRRLLIETYPITPTGFNWEIRRWDGNRFHRDLPNITPEWSERIHLWETEDGRLVGVAHAEGTGDAFFELHPAYRQIEEEMIVWAEEHLATSDSLDIPVFDYDSPRRRLLEKRGYQMLPYTFVTRRLRLWNMALPHYDLAHGYVMRGTRSDDADYQRLADVLNAGFNRTIHNLKELRNFGTRSPSFRHDLNLVAEASDGTFAAHVGVTYDETNRRGIFEPVCTHPEHRRKGLARVLMLEGMRLLQTLGAADVYVDTGDAIPANALYEDVGFTEAYRGNIWRKVF